MKTHGPNGFPRYRADWSFGEGWVIDRKHLDCRGACGKKFCDSVVARFPTFAEADELARKLNGAK